MRGDDRRRQLLDAAARIIVEHGSAAMSMERLGAEAGVSKALPYKHFANSDAVLVELYRRETRALGRAVWRALGDAPRGTEASRDGVGRAGDGPPYARACAAGRHVVVPRRDFSPLPQHASR